MSARSPRPFRLVPLVLALAAAPACDDAAEPEPEDAGDLLVVERTSATLGSTAMLTYLAELFSADPTWAQLEADVARRLAVVVTRARIETILSSLQCRSEFSTDNETFIEASFHDCSLVVFDLEGQVHAELTLETAPCECSDPAATEPCECASAVQWQLSGPGITLGPAAHDSTRFSGPVLLRDSVDPDEPMTWQTQDGFFVEKEDGQRLDTRSTASWLLDRDTSCLSISIDARIELPVMQDDLDESIGVIVVSASDVDYCPDACPTAGDVDISYGQGRILSWSYDGSDVIQVTGPRGKSFAGSLDCRAEDRFAPHE